ncbi:hypothetical protein D770_06780 [Flammeovirgaceae bacterium 311]|nr:hypothetical protein D770_06780 [Flammeovirgaceae bacterium 311]
MQPRLILLLIFCSFLGLSLSAQVAPFEQQKVLFADGIERTFWISLDEHNDVLHYKRDKEEQPATFLAADVVSFSFGGNQYYTLPIEEEYFTYFKVYHEGKEFAVLEKYPNYETLKIVAAGSEGNLFVCQPGRKKDDRYYLCYEQLKIRPSLPQNYLPPPFIRHQRSLEVGYRTGEIEVKKLLYLALEGQFKLFYMENDERLNIWDDLMSAKPGDQRTQDMLKKYITDENKINAIRKKVKQEKLDLRDPKDLIIALESVYQ